MFEKTKGPKHIRPLYVNAHLDGRPIDILVEDNVFTINAIHLGVLLIFNTKVKDLISTDLIVSVVVGDNTMLLLCSVLMMMNAKHP